MDWPTAYLQPDPKQDCNFYSTAYICRCLGYPDVVADDVRAFRETPDIEGRYTHEAHYPERLDGIEMQPYWRDHRPDGGFNDRWWLGPTQQSWVEQMLADGWIARADVLRVTFMGHAVVVLESRGDTGVLLMDPVHGMVVEPWEWFLAGGPGHECHRIEAWYRRKATR